MSNITFNVSKKWFDLYKSGVKRKEFRAMTPHWQKRLMWKNQGFAGPIGYSTVTICCGYPPKDDMSRRMTFKWVSTTIGFAEEGIGKELMGEERVFVITMEDI